MSETSASEDRGRDQRLVETMSSACDGPLTDSDLIWLEEQLAADTGVRRAWLDFSRLHAELFIRSRAERVLTESITGIRESMTSPIDAGVGGCCVAPVEAPRARRPEFARRRRPRYSRIGAAVAVVAGVAAALIAFPADEGDKADEAIAQITRKIDCVWEGDRWANSSAQVVASKVYPGQTLTLSHGLMELRLTTGVEITLQAPATFTLESIGHGVLSLGSLIAHVPEPGRGFSVATPSGKVVDYGTRFGLMVRESGDTETHVFEGKVVVHPAPKTGGAEAIALTDDMALRVPRDDAKAPAAIAAAPARFTRLDFSPSVSKALPVVDRDLVLWYSAGGRLQLDEKGRVVGWGDLRSPSNAEINDAWQVRRRVRPKWVENAVGGRPALRFGGGQNLVTPPVGLGPDMTAVAVLAPDEELFKTRGPRDNSGLQVFNTNAPPRLVFGLTTDMKPFARMRTGARTGPNGKSIDQDAFSLTAPARIGPGPAVIIAVCDTRSNQSRIYSNGEVAVRSVAPSQEPTIAARCLGSHANANEGKFFYGDIAEVMVYNTGLSHEECESLSLELMDKYSISR